MAALCSQLLSLLSPPPCFATYQTLGKRFISMFTRETEPAVYIYIYVYMRIQLTLEEHRGWGADPLPSQKSALTFDSLKT